MTIPVEFTFSQGNIHDFLDCPRRFQLRYLHRLAWPAVATEPVIELEEQMRRGQAFHHLVQQYWTGIPSDKLKQQISDPNLWSWWQSFELFAQTIPSGDRYSEVILAAPFLGFRLVAKFDLAVVQPDGHISIYDWKTSKRRTPRENLLAHPQTRLYRWMAVVATQEWLDGNVVQPDQVTMTYWFTSDPSSPEILAYSSSAFTADEHYLREVIDNISQRGEDDFEMTSEIRTCQFCQYRSLCDRGIKAGVDVGELDEDMLEAAQPIIDMSQIDEVAF